MHSLFFIGLLFGFVVLMAIGALSALREFLARFPEGTKYVVDDIEDNQDSNAESSPSRR
jgi:hypothetical protein